MREIFGIILRFTIPVVICGALGILVAANWGDPDNVAAGALIGVSSVMLGFVIGVVLQVRHDDKTDAEASK